MNDDQIKELTEMIHRYGCYEIMANMAKYLSRRGRELKKLSQRDVGTAMQRNAKVINACARAIDRS